MKRYMILGSLLGAAAFLTSATAMADGHRDKRYHDRAGHDYHVYNDHEDRAYRLYLGERHEDYREFGKIKAAQRDSYFRWRHQHPDSVLFKVEVR